MPLPSFIALLVSNGLNIYTAIRTPFQSYSQNFKPFCTKILVTYRLLLVISRASFEGTFNISYKKSKTGLHTFNIFNTSYENLILMELQKVSYNLKPFIKVKIEQQNYTSICFKEII